MVKFQDKWRRHGNPETIQVTYFHGDHEDTIEISCYGDDDDYAYISLSIEGARTIAKAINELAPRRPEILFRKFGRVS